LTKKVQRLCAIGCMLGLLGFFQYRRNWFAATKYGLEWSRQR
jgi:hypothetical protein